MSGDQETSHETDRVKRIILRADERAVADYNRRLAQLGDTPEGDALRQGWKYGKQSGRAEGIR